MGKAGGMPGAMGNGQGWWDAWGNGQWARLVGCLGQWAMGKAGGMPGAIGKACGGALDNWQGLLYCCGQLAIGNGQGYWDAWDNGQWAIGSKLSEAKSRLSVAKRELVVLLRTIGNRQWAASGA
jgi:hypothetical protein